MRGRRTLNTPLVAEDVKWRIVGPRTVNGMNVWTLHEVTADGSTGKQLGGPCFSYGEAVGRARKVASGKVSFFFGGLGFEKKAI